MENKKYTIKYSKPNHSNTNTNTNIPTHETQLTNTHPLIKTSIRKAIATCLTFSLVVSVVGYAQALNKTGEDNLSTLSKTEISSPHYIAIKNFQTQKENYKCDCRLIGILNRKNISNITLISFWNQS